MTEIEENELLTRIRLLEQRIRKLEILLEKEDDLFLDARLKVEGFK